MDAGNESSPLLGAASNTGTSVASSTHDPLTRDTIREAGEKIMREYCSSQTPKKTIIFPPVPKQKHVDVFTENDLKTKRLFKFDGQRKDFEAECSLYRALESLTDERNMLSDFSSPSQHPDDIIVLHNFEYTKDQSQLFIDNPQAGVKLPGHGEHDFVVILKNRAIVLFEVKAPTLYDSETASKSNSAFEKPLKSSRSQLKKIAALINAMAEKYDEPNPKIFKVSAFPTVERTEDYAGYAEKVSPPDLILFTEDINRFQNWWENNIINNIFDLQQINNNVSKTETTLIGLWCMNGKNDTETENCSVASSIRDIDSRLRSEKIALKPKVIKSENIMTAPEVFRTHLGIEYITKEQANCFQKDRLFVNGVAGSGKSILIQAKIIALLKKRDERKLIIIILPYIDSAEKYINVFKKAGISVRDKPLYVVDLHVYLLLHELNQLQPDNDVIICISIWGRIAKHKTFDDAMKCYRGLLSVLEGTDCHIFIDDFQDMFWLTADQNNAASSVEYGPIAEVILWSLSKLLKIEDTSRVVWLANDTLQTIQIKYADTKFYPTINAVIEKILAACANDTLMLLTTDLRNTYEISNILAKIRDCSTELHYPTEQSTSSQTSQIVRKIFPPQHPGHFIHGRKPYLYCVLGGKVWDMVKQILKNELHAIFGMDEKLNPIDVAIIPLFIYRNFAPYMPHIWDQFLTGHKAMLEEIAISQDWNDINHCFSDNVKYAHSLEFPVVVLVVDLTYAIESTDDPWFMRNILSHLYVGISRARVYCTVILVCRDQNPRSGFWYVFDILKEHMIVKCIKNDEEYEPNVTLITDDIMNCFQQQDFPRKYQIEIIDMPSFESLISNLAGTIGNIIQHSPDLVYIHLGVNDIVAGKTPEEVTTDFIQLLETLLKNASLKKCRFVFSHVLPSADPYGKHLIDLRTRITDCIRTITIRLKKAGGSHRDVWRSRVYINHNSNFFLKTEDGSNSNSPDPSMFTEDSKHLSENGIKQIMNNLKLTLDEILWR